MFRAFIVYRITKCNNRKQRNMNSSSVFHSEYRRWRCRSGRSPTMSTCRIRTVARTYFVYILYRLSSIFSDWSLCVHNTQHWVRVYSVYRIGANAKNNQPQRLCCPIKINKFDIPIWYCVPFPLDKIISSVYLNSTRTVFISYHFLNK